MSQSSTAGDLADEVACSKALQPDCYALHIVLGNSEAERTLYPTERVLTVMQMVQCDFFFCLKRNVFAERVKPYVSLSASCVCGSGCVRACMHSHVCMCGWVFACVSVSVCMCVCACVGVCVCG